MSCHYHLRNYDKNDTIKKLTSVKSLTQKSIKLTAVVLISWLFVFVFNLVFLQVNNNFYNNAKYDLSAEGEITAVAPSINTDGNYEVSTAGHLKYISQNSSMWNKSFVQTTDIEYTENKWNTIGNETTEFKGKYEANYHTITFTEQLIITSKYAGVFGYTDNSTFVISNLRVCWKNGILVQNTNSELYVGGIIGLCRQANRTSLQNCSNEGNFNISTTATGALYVGGITGSLSGLASLSSCYNLSNITVGNENTNLAINVGGIAGYGGDASIYYCYNSGTINAISKSTVECAGIFANDSSGSSAYNCYNIGDIKAHSINGTATATGIKFSNHKGSIDKCFNGGNISAISDNSSATACGVATSMSNSMASGYDCFTISYENSPITISANGTSATVYANGPGATNSYYDSNIIFKINDSIGTPSDSGASVSGLNELMKDEVNYSTSGAVTWKKAWDFADGTGTWGINESINNGYPILRDTSNRTVTYRENKDDNLTQKIETFNLIDGIVLTNSLNSQSVELWTDGNNSYASDTLVKTFSDNVVLWVDFPISNITVNINFENVFGGVIFNLINNDTNEISQMYLTNNTEFTLKLNNKFEYSIVVSTPNLHRVQEQESMTLVGEWDSKKFTFNPTNNSIFAINIVGSDFTNNFVII